MSILLSKPNELAISLVPNSAETVDTHDSYGRLKLLDSNRGAKARYPLTKSSIIEASSSTFGNPKFSNDFSQLRVLLLHRLQYVPDLLELCTLQCLLSALVALQLKKQRHKYVSRFFARITRVFAHRPASRLRYVHLALPLGHKCDHIHSRNVYAFG